jgi:hypothetical protein
MSRLRRDKKEFLRMSPPDSAVVPGTTWHRARYAAASDLGSGRDRA